MPVHTERNDTKGNMRGMMMNERNELVETEWAVDTSIVADAKLPVKDEAVPESELID